MNFLKSPSVRLILFVCFASTVVAACGKSDGPNVLVPIEIDHTTACSLDGMLLADYPGPKAQIHYADHPDPDFFCDTVEMFAVYLKPEQVRAVRAVMVQDMGQANWDEPRENWIDATTAWYVHGSGRHGSMGPTIASFALEADARTFSNKYGGKVVKFSDVTPAMARLDGGAMHDKGM